MIRKTVARPAGRSMLIRYPPMEQCDYLRMPQSQPHLKVIAVLRRWDPIGVISEDNQDEYDGYSGDVVRLLDRGATVDDIVDYMRWVVTERMEIAFDGRGKGDTHLFGPCNGPAGRNGPCDSNAARRPAGR